MAWVRYEGEMGKVRLRPPPPPTFRLRSTLLILPQLRLSVFVRLELAVMDVSPKPANKALMGR